MTQPSGSACDAVCPMRLKPRNVKRWMFACTQCGQCISACATVNRDNPEGPLLRWVAGDAAEKNEARFSALSQTDEDAGALSWYQQPTKLAGVGLVTVVALNIMFW